MIYFAEKVKKVRKELNITQEQLARELGVSFSTVNRWEREKASPNNLARIALDAFCKNRNLNL